MDLLTKYKLIEKIILIENDIVLNQVNEILKAAEIRYLNEDMKIWNDKESEENSGYMKDDVAAALRKKYNS